MIGANVYLNFNILNEIFFLLQLFFFFALVALVFAGDVKKDESKKSADTAKPKRGLAGLGYGFNDFGYSFPGFSSYNAYEPLAHTVITKQLAYPVPHPVPVPVERHVPYPVKVNLFFLRFIIFNQGINKKLNKFSLHLQQIALFHIIETYYISFFIPNLHYHSKL